VKETTITLGGKEYTVTQPRLRALCAWQKQVAKHTKEILAVAPDVMTALSPILQAQAPLPDYAPGDNTLKTASGWLSAITEQTLPGLINAALAASDAALDAFPIMLDLIFAFDMEAGPLDDDRERIEAEVTQDEVTAAFIEVVKFSFPFGLKLGDLFKALTVTTAASGATTATTTPSSPSPNGADGTTN
jgi:hypothetical protein